MNRNLKITRQKQLTNSQPEEFKNGLANLVSMFQFFQNQDELNAINTLRKSSNAHMLTLDRPMLSKQYTTNGLLQTAIDTPIYDAMRGGLEIQSGQLDPDDVKKFEEFNEEIETNSILTSSRIWASLYGGGAIIVNTDENPSKPLANGSEFRRLEFYSANRWELSGGSQYKCNDSVMEIPMMDGTRNIEHYDFYGTKIHKSRVIALVNKEAPDLYKWQLRGWGMSELERIIRDFNMYIRTNNVIYELLEEAKVDVFNFENLNTTLGSKGETDIYNRVSMMNQLKRFNNALVLDKMDTFTQKQLSFSGLPELLKENRIALSAAMRMPQTKLWGISSAGFNAGEDDIENYNARIESEIRTPMKRKIKKVYDIVFQHLFGFVPVYSISFKPLRVLSSKDEEDIKRSKTDRNISLYERGLLTSEEIGNILEKENIVPIQTRISDGAQAEVPEGLKFGQTSLQMQNMKGKDARFLKEKTKR